jgi:DNA-binding response OmpR family regulator
MQQEEPDIVCLDVMMPGVSGYDVCRAIRTSDETVPILFISAKGEEVDKVLGLELGADDYIVKPFGVKEVIARIRAASRRIDHRRKRNLQVSFTIGNLLVDPLTLTALRNDKTIELTLREVKMLALLAEHSGKVVDRDTFLDRCWGMDYFPSSRTLDQHIAMLRKKIELDPKDPKIVQTVHGSGYRYPGAS